METTYSDLDKTRPATCRKCKGGGLYKGFGVCYSCSGSGVVYPHRVTITREETEVEVEYREGLASRERRAAERRARIAARETGR